MSRKALIKLQFEKKSNWFNLYVQVYFSLWDAF